MSNPADPLAFLATAEIFTESDPFEPNPRDEWWVNDSSLGDYSEFSGLPRNFSGGLGGLILKTIGEDSGNVGVDIAGGANGKVLQELLERGILGKALVTNYRDKRADETKALEALHHQSGDLRDKSTWESMDEWLAEYAPEGLALVMHRPSGTLQEYSPAFYEGAFNFLFDRSRPGSIHFFQIPESLVIPSPERTLKPACERLRAKHPVEILHTNVDPKSDFPKIPAHVVLQKN